MRGPRRTGKRHFLPRTWIDGARSNFAGELQSRDSDCPAPPLSGPLSVGSKLMDAMPIGSQCLADRRGSSGLGPDRSLGTQAHWHQRRREPLLGSFSSEWRRGPPGCTGPAPVRRLRQPQAIPFKVNSPGSAKGACKMTPVPRRSFLLGVHRLSNFRVSDLRLYSTGELLHLISISLPSCLFRHHSSLSF